MAGGLPEGLVTSNTGAVSQDIEASRNLPVEDLIRLWRVYSANKELLPNGVGKRLEHFFWRILGSSRVRTRLSGSQVAQLFAIISEGNIIRTTPRSSPRSSRAMPSKVAVPNDAQGEYLDFRSSPTPNAKATIKSASTQAEALLSSAGSGLKGVTHSSSSKPSSILRKPGIEGVVQPKMARILTSILSAAQTGETQFEQSSLVGRSFYDSSANEDTAAIQSQLPVTHGSLASETSDVLGSVSPDQGSEFSSIVPSSSSSSRTSKKRTAFAVNSGKRRPSMPRRKSSQTASNTSRIAVSSASTSSVNVRPRKPVREDEIAFDVQQGAVSSCSRIKPLSRSTSPTPESPFNRPPRDHVADPYVGDGPRPLLQPDFQKKYNTQAQADHRPLNRVASKSALASGHATSFQAQGSLFAFGEKNSVDQGAMRRGPAFSSLSIDSVQGADDRNYGSGALPRSRSQLTLLLENGRRKAGDAEMSKNQDAKKSLKKR